MRLALRTLGVLITLLGAAVALYGPYLFEAMSGQVLPLPRTTNPTAMTIWSGVAFVRLAGAGLVLAGAVLCAGTAARCTEKSMQRAVFWSAALGVWIAWVQQRAIWSGSAGWLFIMAFAVLVVISGLGLARPRLDDLRGKHA